MLPAWATVAIALGGSLIGALADVLGGYFTLRATGKTIYHEEREARRSRLIDAAQDFSVAWTGLFQDLADPLRNGAPLDEELWKRIDEETLDVARRFVRVSLLFGDSPTTTCAT